MIFTIMDQYYNLFCQLQQYSTLNQFICFLMPDFSEFDSGLTFSFKYTYTNTHACNSLLDFLPIQVTTEH